MKAIKTYGGWLLCVLLCLCVLLQGCHKDKNHPLYEEEYTYDDVEAAYNEGYAHGYDDGCAKVCGEIEWAFEDADCLTHEHARYRYIEDVMVVLTNYADGQPISQSELVDAIWDLHAYHIDLQRRINRISDDYSE